MRLKNCAHGAENRRCEQVHCFAPECNGGCALMSEWSPPPVDDGGGGGPGGWWFPHAGRNVPVNHTAAAWSGLMTNTGDKRR